MNAIIKFKSLEIEWKITPDGFKLRSKGMKKWEYVRKKYIQELCSILNGTFDGKQGRFKLSIPLSKRKGILNRQTSIIRNTAIITCAIFPDYTYIESGFIVSTKEIPLSDEFFIERKRILLNKTGNINIERHVITPVLDELQQTF